MGLTISLSETIITALTRKDKRLVRCLIQEKRY